MLRGPSLCLFVLLQLQRHPLETALPPRDQDCSSGSSATWRGEHTAGERPGRRGRTARGVWGGDPRSGPSSVRAAVRGSSVSSLPLQPPQSQWGTHLTRTDGASVSRAQGALLPVRRRCSGGFRAADPQPAVKARTQVQRRLPCSSTARSAPPAEPKATAFEAT